MIYLPPHEFWYLTVAKIFVTFDDMKEGTGTGFFILHKDTYFLVTARHVIDPKYLPSGKKRHAVCNSITIFFQCAINPGTSDATVGYKRIQVSEPDFHHEQSDVDVALLKIPQNVLPEITETKIVRPFSFPLDFLATDADLSTRHAGEPVVFIGFPEKSPVIIEEGVDFHYPILRQGVFAYPPIHGIDIDGQLGKNYGLLDSYALSGFSGGPIVSLQKGWPDGSWHSKEDYRPAKVVGLICGHYISSTDRANGQHSGISFFARSSSIINLIEKMSSSPS